MKEEKNEGTRRTERDQRSSKPIDRKKGEAELRLTLTLPQPIIAAALASQPDGGGLAPNRPPGVLAGKKLFPNVTVEQY